MSNSGNRSFSSVPRPCISTRAPSGSPAAGRSRCSITCALIPVVKQDRLTADELAAWRGFLQVHSDLTHQLDAELQAEHDLPLTSYEVLLFLNDAPEGRLRMSELADRVLLSRSGLTRLVDRLEKRKLVGREACPDDARGFFAVITDAGRDTFAASRRTHLAGVRRLFLDRLSATQRRELAEAWETLLAERHRARAPRPAAHLAQRPGQALDALLDLGGREHREGQPHRGLRPALGRHRAAGHERHPVADRLGVERALVDGARAAWPTRGGRRGAPGRGSRRAGGAPAPPAASRAGAGRSGRCARGGRRRRRRPGSGRRCAA